MVKYKSTRTTVSEESNGREKHGKGYLWGAVVHEIKLGSEKNKRIGKHKRTGRYGGVSTANKEFFVFEDGLRTALALGSSNLRGLVEA